MDYVRKNFTLPVDVAEKLGGELNQSAVVVEALRVRWAAKDTLKRLVAVTDALEKKLNPEVTLGDLNRQFELGLPEAENKPSVTAGLPCCERQRPDPIKQTVPCRHWLRNEGGDFVNTYTGEVLVV